MSRRSYDIQLTINGRKLTQVIIDPHYQEKHGESVSDENIIVLVD